MRQRIPIVMSTAALLVAVLGSTPLGQAAGDRLTAIVPFAKTSGFAKFAGNASKLNGRRSTLSGAPGTIPVVGKDGRLAASMGAVGPQGPRGPQGERGPQGLPGSAGGGSSSGSSRPSGPAGGSLTGSYPNPLIAPNAIGGGQVAANTLTGGHIVDNSLKGADVDESTLGQVPSALIGGFGRTGVSNAFSTICDPESAAFMTCGSVPLTTSAPARVLVVARALARAEPDAKNARGLCRIATSSAGPVPGSTFEEAGGRDDEGPDTIVLVAVTPALPAGANSFRIECNQDPQVGAIFYYGAQVTAVALSPS